MHRQYDTASSYARAPDVSHSLIIPSKQASEAKLAGVEAQSQTRIQQLDADVERMKAEIDATSRKWQESMQQLQMVSDELEATKSGASLWITFLV
jgi:peptidoglycan hydrolase CwlO-like protein